MGFTLVFYLLFFLKSREQIPEAFLPDDFAFFSQLIFLQKAFGTKLKTNRFVQLESNFLFVNSQLAWRKEWALC
jgi:hypothetical protein